MQCAPSADGMHVCMYVLLLLKPSFISLRGMYAAHTNIPHVYGLTYTDARNSHSFIHTYKQREAFEYLLFLLSAECMQPTHAPTIIPSEHLIITDSGDEEVYAPTQTNNNTHQSIHNKHSAGLHVRMNRPKIALLEEHTHIGWRACVQHEGGVWDSEGQTDTDRQQDTDRQAQISDASAHAHRVWLIVCDRFAALCPFLASQNINPTQTRSKKQAAGSLRSGTGPRTQ